MNAIATETEFPPSHWMSRAAFPLITGLMLLGELALWFAVHQGWYWLAVPLVLLVAHFVHGQLIGFHEASHGLLRKNRTLNEIDGVLIGVFSFVSFTLYRASHQTHHLHLGSERDEELWPFVNPRAPRWTRLLAACLELTLGMFFTPFLFFRSFLRKGSPIRAARVRRRIWLELALMVVTWTLLITLVGIFGVWNYFLWLYFLPAWIAGNLQSVRKYIEHVGLTGTTLNSATRNIVANHWAGRLLSISLLHEPFHGVHHIQTGLHHHELPSRAAWLRPAHPDEPGPFPSYWRAFVHLFQRLSDPRVGAQWRSASETPPGGDPSRNATPSLAPALPHQSHE